MVDNVNAAAQSTMGTPQGNAMLGVTLMTGAMIPEPVQSETAPAETGTVIQATELDTRIATQTAANATANTAQAEGRTSGTAAALRTSDGQIFTGVSVGKGGTAGANHPEIQKALDSVPNAQQSLYHGGCGEIQCLNQALNEGVDVNGSQMATATIRKPDNPAHGTPNPACSTCAHVMDQLGVNH